MLRILFLTLLTFSFSGCKVTDDLAQSGDDSINKKVGEPRGAKFFDNIQKKATPNDIEGLWVLQSNNANPGFEAKAYYIGKEKMSVAVQCDNAGTPIFSYVEVPISIAGNIIEIKKNNSYGARYINAATGEQMECPARVSKGNQYWEVNQFELSISRFQTQPSNDLYLKMRDNL